MKITVGRFLFIFLIALSSCSGIEFATDNSAKKSMSFLSLISGNHNAIPAGPVGSAIENVEIPECDNNCVYIRSGASGDGSDWDNALDDLPVNLARGSIYYIADGTYQSYDFNDAESSDEQIYIVKATTSQHGTSTGWNDSYGDQISEFGPISITAPYYVIEGQGSLRILGQMGGVVLDIDSHDTIVSNCEINGNFLMTGGSQTMGACAGLGINYSANITIRGCEIHNIADDGVSISTCSNLTFQSNTIHNLHGCGTDGGCGPCYNGHSDGIEIHNTSNSLFAGNFIYDVESTSAFFFSDWDSTTCDNIRLVNNIFYIVGTGAIAYLINVHGIDVYNNTFWGQADGAFGGLMIGPNVNDLRLYNNIILSINCTFLSGCNASEHGGDYNLFGISLGQYVENSHDIEANTPGFAGIPGINGPEVGNPTPEDFRIVSGTSGDNNGFPGNTEIIIPDDDFFFMERGTVPDRGAVESTP